VIAEKAALRARCRSISLAAALAAVVATAPARAEEIALRIGAGHPVVQAYVTLAKEFFVPEISRRAAERTKYTVRWTEAYGGAVAKLPEVLEAVQSGLLDIGALSLPFNPSQLYLNNYCYYVPFTSPDPRDAIKIARRLYDEFPPLHKQFEKYGQRLIAIGATGDYDIITTGPWETLTDLRRYKIGSAGPNLPWLTGTGATPVQASLNDAYTGMQTGVYQGYMVFPRAFVGYRLSEVGKHVKLVHFGAMPINVMTINLRTWNRLPPELQKIVEEVSKEYEQRVGELAKKQDDEALAAMKAQGVILTELPAAERERWALALQELPRKAAADGDRRGLPMTALLKKYIELLRSEGYKLPVDYKLE
jgi:TRAP-type C4-dicarboxylate transport system substrate-binding protein